MEELTELRKLLFFKGLFCFEKRTTKPRRGGILYQLGKITVYRLLVFNLSTPKGGESVEG